MVFGCGDDYRLRHFSTKEETPILWDEIGKYEGSMVWFPIDLENRILSKWRGKMALRLDDVSFEINTKTRDTAFFIEEEDEGLECGLDCRCNSNIFMGETISPSLCLNPFKTNAKDIEALAGTVFEMGTIDEALEREDTLYVFEHEPLENYKLIIIEIKDSMVHIKCTGVAVTDSFADPYQTAELELDCWLPIITSAADWAKFGL